MEWNNWREKKGLFVLIVLFVILGGSVLFMVYSIWWGGKPVLTPTPTTTPPLNLDQDLIKDHLAVAAGSKISIPKATAVSQILSSGIPSNLSIFLKDNPKDTIYRKLSFPTWPETAGYYILFYDSSGLMDVFNRYNTLFKGNKDWKILRSVWGQDKLFAMIELDGAKYQAVLSFSRIQKENKTEVSIQIFPKLVNK